MLGKQNTTEGPRDAQQPLETMDEYWSRRDAELMADIMAFELWLATLAMAVDDVDIVIVEVR